nr:MAG TPA: hypothetical protein [Caudoviricetes sp.]
MAHGNVFTKRTGRKAGANSRRYNFRKHRHAIRLRRN